MLDLLSIVSTTAACIFVAFRAMQMDRRLPWFGREPAGKSLGGTTGDGRGATRAPGR